MRSVTDYDVAHVVATIEYSMGSADLMYAI